MWRRTRVENEFTHEMMSHLKKKQTKSGPDTDKDMASNKQSFFTSHRSKKPDETAVDNQQNNENDQILCKVDK